MSKRVRRLFVVAAITVGVAACAFVAASWLFLQDLGSPQTADELRRLRKPCGIGDIEFDTPTRSSGDRFGEETYRYSYERVSARWVDTNVLRRFGPSEAIDQRAPLSGDVSRVAGQTNWGGPPLISAQGALVFSSPFSLSVTGTTTFDVFRSVDPTASTYTVIVECNNKAGINSGMTDGAVTTIAP